MLKRIKISSDTLKLIALVSMTIDHIGYLLLPEYFSLRVIGRLAFPIFAYYVAVGVEHTRDAYKYMYRVMVFACVTQILFYLVGLDFQNVLFTYALAILGLIGYKHTHYEITIGVLFLAAYLNCDYSYYGILIVYTFYFFKEHKIIQIILFLILTGIFIFDMNFKCNFEMVKRLYMYRHNNWELIGKVLVEYVALLAYPLIAMDSHVYKRKEGIMRYFFYIYYPLHLVLFKLVSSIILK